MRLMISSCELPHGRINGGRQTPEEMAEEELAEEELARYREVGYVPADSEHDPSADLMHTNAIKYN